MTARDDSVAILHGSADNSLRWVWLSKKSGTITIARVDRGGFFFSDFGAPGSQDIAAALPRIWSYQLAGVNLSGHATHHLAPPSMQSIEPLPCAAEPEFKTEAMF